MSWVEKNRKINNRVGGEGGGGGERLFGTREYFTPKIDNTTMALE